VVLGTIARITGNIYYMLANSTTDPSVVGHIAFVLLDN